MGSPNQDRHAVEDERPQHDVEVGEFALAATPITVVQYAAVVGRAFAKEASNLPVTGVSWNDAVDFCNALSRLTGRQPCYTKTLDGLSWQRDADGFRLPEETEWEYACRAGTETRYFFGDDMHRLGEFAWHLDNSEGRTHPVGQKKPNPWDLYDVYGNVLEWAWDEYGPYPKRGMRAARDERRAVMLGHPADGIRVLRGGSFTFASWRLRSAHRSWLRATARGEAIGFRCAGPVRRR